MLNVITYYSWVTSGIKKMGTYTEVKFWINIATTRRWAFSFTLHLPMTQRNKEHPVPTRHKGQLVSKQLWTQRSRKGVKLGALCSYLSVVMALIIAWILSNVFLQKSLAGFGILLVPTTYKYFPRPCTELCYWHTFPPPTCKTCSSRLRRKFCSVVECGDAAMLLNSSHIYCFADFIGICEHSSKTLLFLSDFCNQLRNFVSMKFLISTRSFVIACRR